MDRLQSKPLWLNVFVLSDAGRRCIRGEAMVKAQCDCQSFVAVGGSYWSCTIGTQPGHAQDFPLREIDSKGEDKPPSPQERQTTTIANMLGAPGDLAVSLEQN